MIPIIILHRNEFDYLEITINSIIKNTIYPYSIHVVDNNSDNAELLLNSLLLKYPLINLYKNKNNNWLYGFNMVLDKITSNYYVLTDADIVVPNPQHGVCWLNHLVNQFDLFPCIGKIGLSLSLENIKDIKALLPLYKREMAFKLGPYKFGTNCVAPIDTTLALYRNDLFITSSFRMRVGHMSLLKPYYYCARASDSYSCYHLGWDKYAKYVQDEYDLEEISKKANFFARYGISMELSLLQRLNFFEINKYKFFKLTFRIYYSIAVVYFWVVYIVKSKLIYMNVIQHESR